MASLTIPKFFFNSWFWFTLMAIVIVIHYFWGKTPPPPKPSEFLAKHKKTIDKIGDIFLISVVLFGWLPIIYMSISIAVEPISNSPYKPEIQAKTIQTACALFLIPAIPISGLSGMLLGLLSVFHSNLTKVKRDILLVICLLPIAFTALLLMIEPSLGPWLIIKFGLGSLAGCWIINGPAIITGKHFFQVSWALLCKLRLVSGDYLG